MSRRLEPWTEASIRSALAEFLDGWRVWPTYDQFVTLGQKGLRDAVTELHGPAWWAREMGLEGGERRPGGVRRWTDERIRETLTEFLDGRDTWPSQREFDEAGLRAFREAIRHYGDARRWAAEMGVAWTPGPRSPTKPPPKRYVRKPAVARPDQRYWTDERIAAELKRFLRGRKVWPRYVVFERAGKSGLYQAVSRYGGAELWAQRMGVKWLPRHGRTELSWTPERVRAALSELLADRSTWPSGEEFIEAGCLQLWRAIRRLGGERYWAAEFGLECRPQPSGALRS